MKFTLTGFSQDENIRQYSFLGIGADRRRTELKVGVDLTLLLKHGIPLQEAPLLCCLLLASTAEHEQERSFMISEGDLRARANQRACERAESRTKGKRPSAPPPETRSSPPANTDFGQEKYGFGLGSRVAYGQPGKQDY